jgi:hypothetical protein
MYGPIPVQSGTQPSIPGTGGTLKKYLRNASTADIRAFLSELKTLPHNHRRLLCKLLKRAAANAPGKVSVVRLADPTPK